MKSMRGILKVAALAALMVAGLGAGGASAGCYLGVLTGGSMANTELSLTGTPLSLDGIGSQSTRPDFGGQIGCDFKPKDSNIVFGGFARYMNQDVAFEVTPGLFSAKLGNSYTVGGRLGYLFNEKTLGYGLVGYTHTDVNWSIASPILPSDMKGWTFGAGVEFAIVNTPLSLALETGLTKYDTQSIAGIVDLKTDQYYAQARLSWNFDWAAAPTVYKPMK